MCVYYYLHYHHADPCPKGIEYEVRYTFCANSTMEPMMESPVSNNHGHHSTSTSTSSSSSGGGEYQLVQQPCNHLTLAPEYDPALGFDYTNLCDGWLPAVAALRVGGLQAGRSGRALGLLSLQPRRQHLQVVRPPGQESP